MLKKIVTSLEVSKELKELGVDLPTLWSWQGYRDVEKNRDRDFCIEPYQGKSHEQYKCYVLETLLDALPKSPVIIDYESSFFLDFEDQALGYFGICDNTNFNVKMKSENNLATTAAKLLIKLLQDKVITAGS